MHPHLALIFVVNPNHSSSDFEVPKNGMQADTGRKNAPENINDVWQIDIRQRLQQIFVLLNVNIVMAVGFSSVMLDPVDLKNRVLSLEPPSIQPRM